MDSQQTLAMNEVYQNDLNDHDYFGEIPVYEHLLYKLVCKTSLTLVSPADLNIQKQSFFDTSIKVMMKIEIKDKDTTSTIDLQELALFSEFIDSRAPRGCGFV
jgi:menaquinone-dependent protoporphyrinogen IX oxidase